MRKYSKAPKNQQQNIKKLCRTMFVLLFLTCAIAWFIGSFSASTTAEPDNTPANEIETNNGIETNYPAPGRTSREISTPTPYQEEVQTFTFSQLAAISNDYLLLVNPEYAVPDYIIGNLVRVADFVTALNADILLNETALATLSTMFDSAISIGFTQFRVTQGFRTHEYQQNLYNQMAGTGLAATPGHSEHQVGLAVDISYHGVNIGNSAQGNWLMSYSYRYGFILRYPQHKTHITGVPFEPWHYRYVGQPHAHFMTHNDMVMEEYIDYLRINREIEVTVDGEVFTVFYLGSEYDVLEIPKSQPFWASRDNTGGIIVTVTN